MSAGTVGPMTVTAGKSTFHVLIVPETFGATDDGPGPLDREVPRGV